MTHAGRLGMLARHIPPGLQDNSSSGHCPAELLTGRQLTTHLNYLNPDQALDKRQSAEVREAPQGFFPGDPEWAKNYASGPTWLPARVL